MALSGRGNPIGVRLTFEAVFPRTGSYAVGPSVELDGENHPYIFQLRRTIRETIVPEPVQGEFRERVVYTFSKVFLPNFLSYDERNAQPCFDALEMGDLRGFPFVSTLPRAANTRLRATVQVDREEADHAVVAAEYVTGRSYDLGAFHNTIVTEGNKWCGS